MKTKLFFYVLFVALMAYILPELNSIMCVDGFGDGCMLAVGGAFAPLKWKMGQNNMGGYRGHLLFIPEDAVATAPVVPDVAAATDNADMVTAKGSFTFTTASGIKSPVYLYSTNGEVGYNAEMQGEEDGHSYQQVLEFYFPGNTAEMHAFAALVKNTRGYYIFEDCEGKQFLLGQPGLCASTSASFNGGKKHADRKGMAFKAVADSNYSAILMGTPVDIRKIGGYEAPVAV